MKNYEFVVWLEGYLDLCGQDVINIKKLRIIKNHLNLVKAIEGELGPFNAEIYRLISDKIEKPDSLASVLPVLRARLDSFLEVAFPSEVLAQKA